MKPIISVCIPTYNQEKYIKKCLLSVLNQDVKVPYEIIVSDDCSTDQTRNIILEICKSHSDKIKYIFNSKNLGPTQNALLARSHALGKYICHCDGDDFFYEEKLRIQYEFLEENSEYVAAWHKIDFFNEDGSMRKAAVKNSVGIICVDVQDMLAFGSWGANSSLMYRYDGVPFKTEKYTMYDFEFCLFLLDQGKLVLLPNILGGYRVNAVGSLTNNLNKNKVNYLREAQLQLWMDYVNTRKEYAKFVGLFSLLTMIKSILKRERISIQCLKGLRYFVDAARGPSLIKAIGKRFLL
jgi:glycosyltransferase involved in cell wall biosynthesis